MTLPTLDLRRTETPKRLSKRKLTDQLVTLIFSGKTNMTENAETLGIGRATAYRYWNQWVESEEAQQLDLEWWSMFINLKHKSPIKAFEGLTRLKIRKTPQKIQQDVKGEIKTEHTETSILIQRYEEVIKRASNRNIQQDSS